MALPSSSYAASRPATGRRGASRVGPLATIAFLLVLIGTAGAFWNWGAVAGPVRAKLAQDPRNRVFTLRAHLGAYIDPRTVVLDLRDVRDAAPVDLFRGLFVVAETLSVGGHEYGHVELARNGRTVYQLSGADFRLLGRDFATGENPVYLMRTLPQKLRKPDGSSAFGEWEGGWLGVATQQMRDLTEAGRHWAAGDE